MSGMIERVAKAIYDADTHDMNKMSNYTPADMVDAARAVLTAMREPTDAMHSAVWHTASDEDADDYWRGMIDAALAEGS